MTDCSCEGFTEIVKSWLAGGSFFFLFLSLLFLSSPFSAEWSGSKAETEKGEVLNGKSSGACHILSHFWPLGLYGWGRSGSSPWDLPLWGEKKRVIQGAWKRRGGTFACAPINTLSFLCWLASQSPWRGLPGNKSDTHASTHTHTHARTHAEESAQAPHTLGLQWCLFIRPLLSLYEVQRVLFFGHVETSGLDWLLELNIVRCSVSCCSFTLPPPSRAKDCKVKRGLILLWYSRPQDALLYKKSMSFIWACSHPTQKKPFIRFPVHRKEECDVGQLIWISYFLFVTVSPCFSFSFFEGLSFGYCISPTGGRKKCEKEVECWVMGEAAVTWHFLKEIILQKEHCFCQSWNMKQIAVEIFLGGCPYGAFSLVGLERIM